MRDILLKTSNAGLYLVTSVLVGTGLALEWKVEDEGRLLGISGDDWSEVHFAVALAFIALALIHLVLNWPWIRAALGQMRTAGLAVAGAGFVLVAVLLLGPTGHGNETEDDEDREEERRDDDAKSKPTPKAAASEAKRDDRQEADAENKPGPKSTTGEMKRKDDRDDD